MELEIDKKKRRRKRNKLWLKSKFYERRNENLHIGRKMESVEMQFANPPEIAFKKFNK